VSALVEPALPAGVKLVHQTSITWSSYSTAQKCRRAYWYTYCEGIERAGDGQQSEALLIGDAVHRLCGGETELPDLPEHLGHEVSTMTAAWLVRWGECMLTPEREIEAWRSTTLLVADGDDSTEVTLGAHCDEIRTLDDGSVIVVERKTAKRIDANYLDRLALDQQIAIQAYLAGTETVIYDVITRAPIKQRTGETEEEYLERKREAARKNKSGTSSIKRKVAESVQQYQQRIVDWYRDNLSEALIRVHVTVGTERALSAITQAIGLAHSLAKSQRLVLSAETESERETNLDTEFPQSSQRCFDWGRRCEYWDLCTSQDSPVIKQELYQLRAKREGDPPTNQEIG
jgi:hypothetical protein